VQAEYRRIREERRFDLHLVAERLRFSFVIAVFIRIAVGSCRTSFTTHGRAAEKIEVKID
jgi:hypothetical protein